MKSTRNFLKVGAEVALLGALVLGLATVFRAVSSGEPASQAESTVAAYPLPEDAVTVAEETAVAPYPPPREEEAVPVWTEPPEPLEPPTPTAPPMPTPLPTPTRRPGPTATPFPIRGPAPDAAGMILYASPIMGLPVDGQGQKVAEAAPLPLALDFTPILGPPSPDGRYLVLLRPVEPGGIPYVFDTQTQRLWPLFRDHPMQTQMSGWVYGWHPDSRQVLFWFFNNEELRLVDAETGQYTVLALTEGPVQGAAISPDGQHIVYVGRRGANEIIWIVSAAGSDARPLFDPVGLSYVFGWSPDGAHILYAGGGSDYSKADAAAGVPPAGGPFWLMDPEGESHRSLSAPSIFGWGFGSVWSPDGQWIAFTGLDEGQTYGCARKDKQDEPDYTTCIFEGTGVYIENVVTGEVRWLASGVEPVWSPDGSVIAFLSNQSGAPEVWSVRIDSTGLQQLTSDARPKWRIFWAPAGR